MTSRTQVSSIQNIPLNKLKKSPRNVRQTPHDKAHIAALADSIEAHGQIQNLVVETEVDGEGKKTGCYLVTAGEGRRLGQLLRVKRKQIKANEAIRCIVDDTHDAQALSLAENELRQSMHPADQFVAFKQLVDGGQSIEEVAAQFGVTPVVVQRRLKLANVAPEFLTLYRKEAINLDHLMALAITDDHQKQKQVWKSLPMYDRHPDSLRRALTENEISAREPIVKFVGLKEYEKAGGLVRHDLFAEQRDGGFVMDPELLRRLAGEKLEKAAAQLKDKGCAWVETIPHLDYATRSTYGRVQYILRDATDKEQARLDALNKQLAEVEQEAQAAEEDEDRLSVLSDRAEEIEAEIENLQEQRKVLDPAQKALAGAIVSIGSNGNLQIEEGLLRPEDAKRFARAAKAAQRVAKSEGPRLHSAKLVRNLTAHRTLALQATLMRQPQIALIAATHRLILETFFKEGSYGESALEMETRDPELRSHLPEIEQSKAWQALMECGKALRNILPAESSELFSWLLKQSDVEVLRLFAFCIARTVNGVQSQEGASAVDVLARAAALDMRQWWSATAENYFSAIPKERIVAAVREAVSPEIAATLTALKKAPLAKAAEQRIADKGWLPGLLRDHAA